MTNTLNRFELEQYIFHAWQITDDLQLLLDNVSEDALSPDDLQNALLGLKVLYQLKFEKLFSSFEACIKKGELV